MPNLRVIRSESDAEARWFALDLHHTLFGGEGPPPEDHVWTHAAHTSRPAMSSTFRRLCVRRPPPVPLLLVGAIGKITLTVPVKDMSLEGFAATLDVATWAKLEPLLPAVTWHVVEHASAAPTSTLTPSAPTTAYGFGAPRPPGCEELQGATARVITRSPDAPLLLVSPARTPTELSSHGQWLYPRTTTGAEDPDGLFVLLMAGHYCGAKALGMLKWMDHDAAIPHDFVAVDAGLRPDRSGRLARKVHWIPKWAMDYRHEFERVAYTLHATPELGHIVSLPIDEVEALTPRFGRPFRVFSEPGAGAPVVQTRMLSTICFANWGPVAYGHQISGESPEVLPLVVGTEDAQGHVRAWDPAELGCDKSTAARELADLRHQIQLLTQRHGWELTAATPSVHYVFALCSPASSRVYDFRRTVETLGRAGPVASGDTIPVQMWRLRVTGAPRDWSLPSNIRVVQRAARDDAHFEAAGRALFARGYHPLLLAGLRLLGPKPVSNGATGPNPHDLPPTVHISAEETRALHDVGLYFSRRLFTATHNGRSVAMGVAFAATTGYNLFGVLDRLHLFRMTDDEGPHVRDGMTAIVDAARRWFESGLTTDPLHCGAYATPDRTDKRLFTVVVDPDNMRGARRDPGTWTPKHTSTGTPPLITIEGDLGEAMHIADHATPGATHLAAVAREHDLLFEKPKVPPPFLVPFHARGAVDPVHDVPDPCVFAATAFQLAVRKEFTPVLVESQILVAPR